jgi:ribosomal protein S20
MWESGFWAEGFWQDGFWEGQEESLQEPSAGAGHPWSAYVSPTGLRKRKWKDQIRDAMREAYSEIINGNQQEIKDAVSEVVVSFANKAALDVVVPQEASIDWTKLSEDIAAARNLLNLWLEWQEIDEEDTLFLMMAAIAVTH